jgi:bud site selection protein 31
VELTINRDVLEDYDKKMRDAETESHEGKRIVEATWCVSLLLSGF